MPKRKRLEIITESDRQRVISLLRGLAQSEVWKSVITPIFQENLEIHSNALAHDQFTDIREVHREQAFTQIIEKFINMPANLIGQLEQLEDGEEENLDLDPFKK